MATGDAAAAAGLHVYTGNELANELWVRDNERGDEIAGRAAKVHTHLSADITDATPNATPNKVVKYNSAGVIAVGTPTLSTHATTKAYVDGKLGGSGNLTVTGNFYNPGASLATSSWTTAYINGDGRLCRGASSQRYKTQIRAWDPDPQGQVLKLKPRQYRWKQSVDPARPRGIGLVAEEVAALPGLDWLVTRDDQGRPEAVHYELLALALLPMVKDLAARVTELEGKVA